LLEPAAHGSVPTQQCISWSKYITIYFGPNVINVPTGYRAGVSIDMEDNCRRCRSWYAWYSV